jgi:two-component system NtrC family sensor kinase
LPTYRWIPETDRPAKLVALSHLACVATFGVLLFKPWHAAGRLVEGAIVLCFGAFCAAALAIALHARGVHRLVFGSFGALALLVAAAEGAHLLFPRAIMRATVHAASDFELAVIVAVLNVLLALYAVYYGALQRRAVQELARTVSAAGAKTATLEQRVVERTQELEAAQRVLQRMWRLGQQITVELHPARVLERFLEAVTDVVQADGGALGMLGDAGTIRVAAATGASLHMLGQELPVAGSAMGRVIRTGRPWSVTDVTRHGHELHRPTFDLLSGAEAHGFAIIPIVRRGECIGAVTLSSLEPREFLPAELERVEAMADLLSVALSNAELVETLRQAEWRFRTLFRAAPDAVLTVLKSGRVREANDAVREVFGLDPAHVVGRVLADLIIEEDRQKLEAALAAALAGAPTRLEVTLRREAPAGPEDPHRVVALAVSRLPEADPPSVLLIGRDMTAEREMRLRLMESDRLAAVGELVAGVAHEVNNPLASISAFAQLLLRDGGLTEPQRESLEVIKAETLRASQVVKDLLAFARRSEPHREPLDMNLVVTRTLRLRHYQLSTNEILVETELGHDLPSVVGDARQLQQVCLNLITNAIQAMAPMGGGRLRVATRAQGPSVVIEVSDTGHGIPPEARARVFEPFFTTKGEGEGTGLGLSVSYGIVTAHGGTIEVAETSSSGTTFRITLPSAGALAEEGSSGRAQPPLMPRSPLHGVRLLVVDDEPALRSGIEAFGQLRGFTVLTAANGEEALELIQRTAVDAIVCDLRMPELDGFGLYDRLLHERPGLAARMVFITGDLLSAERRRAIRQPIIAKPFAFERLEEALVAVMRGMAGGGKWDAGGGRREATARRDTPRRGSS